MITSIVNKGNQFDMISNYLINYGSLFSDKAFPVMFLFIGNRTQVFEFF